jgi:hypothetical protein
MSTATTFDVVHVDTPATPRGSLFAAQVFARLAGWLKPAPARTLSRAEEAAEVRQIARSVQTIDPGFAADLYAAAARHESLDD